MLSKEERREMLEDAKNKHRRNSLRVARTKEKAINSFDEYTSFLDGVQKIFSPFKIPSQPTPTGFNKL